MALKKKIFIWTGSFYPKVGGLEVASLEYSKYLIKKGYEVTVITNKNPSNLPSKDIFNGIVIKRFRFFHSPINYLKFFRFDLLLSWLFFKIFTLVRLMILFIKNKPSVINLHFPDHQLFEILILKLLFKFDLIVNLHGNEVERLGLLKKYSLRFLFYQILFKNANLIIACSKSLMRKAETLMPNINKCKFKVVQNGVSRIFLSTKTGSIKSDFIFSAMRFVPTKGLDLMIKSLHLLKLKNNIFVAGGKYQEAINIIDDGELDLSVKYIGQISPQLITNYLNETMLTIIPSREETFGIFLAEAICCGSPVVVTNVGGIPEVILIAKKNMNHKQKILFDSFVRVTPPNVKSLSMSIKLILMNKSNIEEYLKLIPIIRKNFEWNSILNNLFKSIKLRT